MKYYLIAGEASGDLHASRLMRSLRQRDPQAAFRCYGGDQMQAAGATLVKHYRELAYMGFIPVLLHMPTILRNMRQAKRDIAAWQPHVVILVDYPGFNLAIAKYVHKHALCPVYYYIAPKIWAWKEHRIKSIRRDVDHLFSILPFEVDFFEKKHHYPIHYVGNPTAEEVLRSLECRDERLEFANSHLSPLTSQPTIALLCGSRRQEIKDNLPAMLRVADHYSATCRAVIAGAPGIEPDYYRQFMEGHQVEIVFNRTFDLLKQAHAALVTSGTATLETALFRVPQVVCYAVPFPRLYGWLRKLFLKVEYVSLVNLIAQREVVPELVADTFTEQRLQQQLAALLPPDSPRRQQMLQGYEEVWQRLGNGSASDNAAAIMLQLLQRSE